MKKMNLPIAVLGMLALASAAFGAEIADIAWDQSNLETLRSFDEAAVWRFLNSGLVEPPDEGIQEFTWSRSGNHQYQLVVVFPPVGSSGANYMSIYSRDSSGKISEDAVDGQAIHLEGWRYIFHIPKVIQDLDGDGKDELVIHIEMGFAKGSRQAAVIWPQVYRLHNGEYVEASRDFANFYDTQVLPEINSDIAEETAPSASPTVRLAALIMTRDKILRVIGRDPKAGEQQAREWMRSPDPDLVGDAITVLDDMGDHEEVLAARRARAAKRKAEAARKAASEGK